MEGYKIEQMKLVIAIMNELSRQIPELPGEPRYMNAAIAAANSVCAELAKPIVKATSGMGLDAWLDSDDTGLSSLYMAHALSCVDHLEWNGDKPRYAYPRDPDDLGRCIRLTEAVPGFGGLIPEMSHKGAEWLAVTSNWANWVELCEAENYEELYQQMKDAGL